MSFVNFEQGHVRKIPTLVKIPRFSSRFSPFFSWRNWKKCYELRRSFYFILQKTFCSFSKFKSDLSLFLGSISNLTQQVLSVEICFQYKKTIWRCGSYWWHGYSMYKNGTILENRLQFGWLMNILSRLSRCFSFFKELRNIVRLNLFSRFFPTPTVCFGFSFWHLKDFVLIFIKLIRGTVF